MLANQEPCPRCGKQPEAVKGTTYWTAYCPTGHLPGRVSSTPMRSRVAALRAWDDDVKAGRIG
jgi:hypothetical protein